MNHAADRAAKLALESRVEQLETRVAELVATHASFEARLVDFEKRAVQQTEPKARKHTAAGKPAGDRGFTYEEALQQCGGEEEIKKAAAHLRAGGGVLESGDGGHVEQQVKMY